MSILALFGGLFLICIATFVLSSWLIRIEYERYRDHWDADGRPADYFGSVPGKYSSRMAVGIAWVFSTPNWMKRDSKARRIVAAYRLLFVLWLAGVITMAILASAPH